MKPPRDFATRAAHAGDRANPSKALAVPIYQTSTFRLESAAEGAEQSAAIAPPAFYTRWGNPTTRALEEAIADLEGGEAALAFSSGMAAGATAVLTLVSAGDHVVAARSLYSGMTELFARFLPRFGVVTTFVDAADVAAIEAALRPTTRLIYVETPANPNLLITDLRAVAALAKRREVFSIADNTYASPYNQQPLGLGIDAVVHSATKSLGGHSDVVAGVVVGARAFVERVWGQMKLLGNNPGPHDSWLVLRGLKTLALRAERMNASALAIARFLVEQPEVKRVHYPGLESHPGHEVAKRQMRGFGSMIAFEIAGGKQGGTHFLEALELVVHAVSLGGPETLASHPASTTHAMLTPEERARAGIDEGLVRLSVGLEDAGELCADLRQALQR
jgi:cystathionine beta-lyase/cystathionine gamma-synthase